MRERDLESSDQCRPDETLRRLHRRLSVEQRHLAQQRSNSSPHPFSAGEDPGHGSPLIASMLWRRWLSWASKSPVRQEVQGRWGSACSSPPCSPSSAAAWRPPRWRRAAAASSPPSCPVWSLMPSPRKEEGQLDRCGCGSPACSGAGCAWSVWPSLGCGSLRPKCGLGPSYGLLRPSSVGQTFLWWRLAEQAGQVLSLLPSFEAESHLSFTLFTWWPSGEELENWKQQPLLSVASAWHTFNSCGVAAELWLTMIKDARVGCHNSQAPATLHTCPRATVGVVAISKELLRALGLLLLPSTLAFDLRSPRPRRRRGSPKHFPWESCAETSRAPGNHRRDRKRQLLAIRSFRVKSWGADRQVASHPPAPEIYFCEIETDLQPASRASDPAHISQKSERSSQTTPCVHFLCSWAALVVLVPLVESSEWDPGCKGTFQLREQVTDGLLRLGLRPDNLSTLKTFSSTCDEGGIMNAVIDKKGNYKFPTIQEDKSFDVWVCVRAKCQEWIFHKKSFQSLATAGE